jgi:hypothetical protein
MTYANEVLNDESKQPEVAARHRPHPRDVVGLFACYRLDSNVLRA